MTSNSYNGGLVWSSLGYNPIKKMLLAVGLQDRGKSQIATIAKYLAGKGKFSLLRTRQLEDRFELGAYRDSNLLYAADVDSRFLMHQGVVMLKALVGGDPLTGEVKFGLTPVEMRGSFNVCLTTNDRLRIRIGSNPESWRNRLWIIEFCDLGSFRIIADIAEKLWKDEGPGIVAWAIRGAALLLEDHATKGKVELSRDQQKRIDKLIAESMSVREFVRVCIIREPKKDMTTDELFENYSDWCQQEKIVPVLERSFQEEIRIILEEDLQVKRSNSIQRFITIKLKNGKSKVVTTQRRGYSCICLNPVWLNSGPSIP